MPPLSLAGASLLHGVCPRVNCTSPRARGTHPLVAPDREALAGNGLPVPNALDEAIADDGVRVLACEVPATGEAGKHWLLQAPGSTAQGGLGQGGGPQRRGRCWSLGPSPTMVSVTVREAVLLPVGSLGSLLLLPAMCSGGVPTARAEAGGRGPWGCS